RKIAEADCVSKLFFDLIYWLPGRKLFRFFEGLEKDVVKPKFWVPADNAATGVIERRSPVKRISVKSKSFLTDINVDISLTDSSLATVITRGLRNFLSISTSDLC